MTPSRFWRRRETARKALGAEQVKRDPSGRRAYRQGKRHGACGRQIISRTGILGASAGERPRAAGSAPDSS